MYNSIESNMSGSNYSSNLQCTPIKNLPNRQRLGSVISTETNTPETSEFDELDTLSHQDSYQQQSKQKNLNFEIDVKPKKKNFSSIEEKKKYVQEYTKKIKTEMCKNWQTTGYCKFQDKCSFAHGSEELKGKQHLHSNYKTKPCKKYFLNGYCSYGNRCQYLHSDLLQVKDFRDFAEKVYGEKNLYLPKMEQYENYYERWQNIIKFLQKYKDTYDIDPLILNIRPRLEVFQELCQNEKLQQLQNVNNYSLNQQQLQIKLLQQQQIQQYDSTLDYSTPKDSNHNNQEDFIYQIKELEELEEEQEEQEELKVIEEQDDVELDEFPCPQHKLQKKQSCESNFSKKSNKSLKNNSPEYKPYKQGEKDLNTEFFLKIIQQDQPQCNDPYKQFEENLKQAIIKSYQNEYIEIEQPCQFQQYQQSQCCMLDQQYKRKSMNISANQYIPDNVNYNS